MEKLANKISVFIAGKLNYDNEKAAVMAYGLAAIFQMVSIFIVSSIIGIILGIWIESMVIFISVGLFRKSTGGAHSQTFQGCMIISIFSIALLSFLARYLFPYSYNNHLLFLIPLILIYTYSFFVIYKLAPVATPNKPIVKIEKIKRLRKNSFITFFIYFLVSLSLYIFSNYQLRFISISISFCFATLWQVFTLTKMGHIIIDKIDTKFRSDNLK